MSEARYNVLTWDTCADSYTEHAGLDNPSLNVSWRGLLRSLRELRRFGYGAWRMRDENGDHYSDWAVLVERVDDEIVTAAIEGLQRTKPAAEKAE